MRYFSQLVEPSLGAWRGLIVELHKEGTCRGVLWLEMPQTTSALACMAIFKQPLPQGSQSHGPFEHQSKVIPPNTLFTMSVQATRERSWCGVALECQVDVCNELKTI